MSSLLVRLELGPPGHFDPDRMTYEKWLELRRDWRDTVSAALPLLLRLAKEVDRGVDNFDTSYEGAEAFLYRLDEMLDELRRDRG